jgi:chromosome segregation ATPase
MKSHKKISFLATPFLVLLCLWMLDYWNKRPLESAQIDKKNSASQASQSKVKGQGPVINSGQATVSSTPLKTEIGKSENVSSTSPIFSQEKTYNKSYFSDNESSSPNPEKNILRIKDHIKEIEKQNLSLKGKVDELSAILETKEKELLKYNDDNAVLKVDLAKAIETQNKTKADLDSEMLQSQQDKNSLQADLNKVKAELGSSKTQNDSLDKIISAVKKDLDDKESQRLRVTEELRKFEESHKAMESELNALKTAKSVNDSQVVQLNLRIEELTKSNLNMKDSVNQLTELLTKKEVEFGDKKNKLSNTKDELDKAIRKKESIILISESKERTISTLSKKLKGLEAKIAQANKESTFAKERQLEAVQGVDNLKSANAYLRQRLLDITIDLELLRAESYFKNR